MYSSSGLCVKLDSFFHLTVLCFIPWDVLSDSKIMDKPTSEVQMLSTHFNYVTFVMLNSEMCMENTQAVVNTVFANSLLYPINTLSAPAMSSMSNCFDTSSLLSFIFPGILFDQSELQFLLYCSSFSYFMPYFFQSIPLCIQCCCCIVLLVQ